MQTVYFEEMNALYSHFRICSSLLQELLEKLAPEEGQDGENADHEAKIFYCKMKGDYFRYKAEVAGPDKKSGLCFISYENLSTWLLFTCQ